MNSYKPSTGPAPVDVIINGIPIISGPGLITNINSYNIVFSSSVDNELPPSLGICNRKPPPPDPDINIKINGCIIRCGGCEKLMDLDGNEDASWQADEHYSYSSEEGELITAVFIIHTNCGTKNKITFVGKPVKIEMIRR